MKPNRIFIIRHGQSEANADLNVHASVPDWLIPITPLGAQQSQEAGKIITSQIGEEELGVYVSPFLRTRQTWGNMLVNIPEDNVAFVKEDPRIREQEWGHLRHAEEYDPIEAERNAYGPFFYRIPDGESGAYVYDRCTGFLNTLYRDFEKVDFPKNVLIVTHGFTMRVLLMRWFHYSVEHFHKMANSKNCEIVVLEKTEVGRFEVKTPWPLKNVK